MRLFGATAAATGAAALLLGVSGADGAPSGPGTAPRPSGPELVAQAPMGVAGIRPPAPSNAAPPPRARHVPIPPRPEAVKVAPGPLGIPGAAYAAYKAAADRMALEAPSCGIEWNLVAAIGRIESGHADGGNVDASGLTLTPIEGPVLDGSLAGNAVIRDGAGFARAMGPMQFLTTTWSLFGGDNNGDGRADVNNVRDAAYGAARYLCSSSSGLESESGQRVAVFAYNQSNSYVDNVVAWSKAYRDRAIPVGGIPDMDAPVAPPKELPKPLPPGRVVVVGCGTPDGARAPGRPGAPVAS
ncbi:lytic transglycosylase domain-containing protein, partial [Tsukamurella sp. 1534]|uniref:lytic transglycosylase domain-containing protein n=1 Tax=Tsukamurella sp. 1534 TaxID=1151061 RepID=UPI0006ACC920